MDKFITRESREPLSPMIVSKRPRDEAKESWQYPKRFAIQKEVSKSNETSTSNRFTNLPIDKNEVHFKKATNKVTSSGIPPIIIELQLEWTYQRLKDTIDKYSKIYHLQYMGQNKVKILCHNNAAHQAVKEGLQDEHLSFYTFTRKNEKLPKAVIKGLPKCLQDNLPLELENVGFPVTKVTELKSSKPAQCPALLVQLPHGTDMSKFKQIKYINNCVVEVQRYRPSKKTGTQCFRCQLFVHASRNCNRPARCVKCSLEHPTSECPEKGTIESVSCCNCQQEHPASYSKCPARLKYLQRISSKRDNISRKALNKNTLIPSEASNVYSYAQVAKASKLVPTSSNSITQETIKPNKPVNTSVPVNPPAPPESSAQDTLTCEMLQILNTIKNLKEQFAKCKDFLEKVILILSHVGRYV